VASVCLRQITHEKSIYHGKNQNSNIDFYLKRGGEKPQHDEEFSDSLLRQVLMDSNSL
jgi:hypothetical protein